MALNGGGDNVSAANHSDEVGYPEMVPMSQECKLYHMVINTLIVGILCILGIMGNITAFMVFVNDKVKTSTSFLFQGLSFIDTILLFCVFPIYSIGAFVSYTGWLPGFKVVEPYILVYGMPLAFVTQTATIWVTVLVGVNRYIAVCMPYQAPRLCNVNQARKQLGVVLLFSILFNLPRFFEGRVIPYTDPETNITEMVPDNVEFAKSKPYLIVYGNILYMVFMLILPLLVLTVLNIRLIKALDELRRKRAEMQSVRQQQDNNVTFVLIIVVLVFTLCQAPALVTQIMWNVLDDTARGCGGVQFYFSRISNMLVILNSAVNFLIYFLFNTRFRQVLYQSMCSRDKSKVNRTMNSTKDAEGTNETLL